ncbi:hypothetical protein [Flavobacterium piscis]|uniref:Lipoprotein n=1 Tax=Flavobacterium piscis TaxID=1114874 RepID=A0ABU1Y8Z4_9FLAO|nr:hypothetical protein [Flavobacterium piscis]MDR7210558.1 hypothetical protein [Flavobacterium piscis]
MKRAIVIVVFVVMGVFVSCQKTATVTPATEEILTAPDSAAQPDPSGNQCYASTANNNTIWMSFNVNSNQEVNGKLSYSLYGKDKNEGTLIGNIYGDTLIADYTFDSEGVSSVRQVAFLQKDGTYIEGYGDVVEANGKVSFKDKKTLKFDIKNTLTKIDCNQED